MGEIWKLHWPTHLNILLWELRHDRLKTAELLFRQSGTDSPICNMCQGAWETSIHAVRDCLSSLAIRKERVEESKWQRFSGETAEVKSVYMNPYIDFGK